MYQVLTTKKVDKNLKKLHPKDAKKVVKKISQLKNPFDKSLNIRKIEEEKGFWRLRIGKIRVVYEVEKKKKRVIIRRIAYRGYAYKH